MSKVILEAVGLRKSLGGRVVLEGINLEIGKGEVVGILGKNGAGKTVLVSMMTGMLTPDGGVVRFEGQDIESNMSKYRQEINLAQAYQSLQLQASVEENLRMFASLYGVEEVEKTIDALLQLVEMEPGKWRKKKMFRMSSGENFRIVLAKALLNRPRVLFLDEPTAFLDPVFRGKMIRWLKRVNKDWGTTMVITSHNLAEVAGWCRRVLVLRSGRATYWGKVLGEKELIKYY